MQTLVYFKRKIKHNYYNITLIFSSQPITQEMLDVTKKKSEQVLMLYGST